MMVRPATAADIGAITAIYAHHVRQGTGTFEEVPPTDDEMTARLAEVQNRGLPWLVAESAEGEILGYAYAAPFRLRTAYRFTLENSAYVSPDAQRRGVGLRLMQEIIEICRAAGYRQMLAVIGDSENAGSIGLHRALGFAHVGVFREVGFKFDRWLDVVMMQKALAD